ASLAVSTGAELWLGRYQSGESAAVWAEMRDLGPEIRSERLWRHASAVATETMIRLNAFEARHGPMPLSLRAFYDVVGTVDLAQSTGQLIHYWPEDRRKRATELEIAGEYDPLVVEFLKDPKNWPGVAGTAWFFACDEFHKANYSGGANYHVVLPDASADFQIFGMADDSEFFVDYLRFTFEGGGFRGPSDANEERAWKVLPKLGLTKQLADGLLPI